MKIKLIIPLIFLLPFSFSCNRDKVTVEVILMGGQSNMEGHDAPFDVLPKDTIAYYSLGHKNVKISFDCTWEYSQKMIDKPYSSNGEFVDVVFGQGRNNTLLGPEVGLAKYLGTHSPNKKYYLIKSCEGGTNLRTQWSENGRCYKTFIEDVDKSLATLKNRNINFKIAGMIWMQGEADSEYDDITKEEYYNNTLSLINRITTRYSNYLDKDSFKWIDSGISTEGRWPHSTEINNAKKDIVLLSNNYRYTWQSESLEKINQYHYTALSYLKLGEAYGYNYLN